MIEALETEALLAEEQSKSKEFQGRVHQLQASVSESADQIRNLISTQKALTERCRDQVCCSGIYDSDLWTKVKQERELQLTNANLKNLRAEAEQHQRRVRYLEEQIQSDDRVEKLESSLKNKQDRADELEFRLSKIKQVRSHQ
jgi:predicted RNase H-like nuclease (RuvC/YqgF family)